MLFVSICVAILAVFILPDEAVAGGYVLSRAVVALLLSATAGFLFGASLAFR
jgi:hypothetical protein